jgi:hypothetical protein
MPEPDQSINQTAKDAKDAKEKLQIPMFKFQSVSGGFAASVFWEIVLWFL